MEDLIIRKATVEDIYQIMEIEAESFSTPWSYEALETELTKNFLAEYVVIVYKNIVIGYGGVWIIYDEGHVTNIAVRKDYRGKGIGSLIVGSLVKICDSKNVKKITLEVRKSNLTAQNLYWKHGFEKEAIRKGYYKDDNEDALIMNRYKDKEIKN